MLRLGGVEKYNRVSTKIETLSTLVSVQLISTLYVYVQTHNTCFDINQYIKSLYSDYLMRQLSPAVKIGKFWELLGNDPITT